MKRTFQRAARMFGRARRGDGIPARGLLRNRIAWPLAVAGLLFCSPAGAAVFVASLDEDNTMYFVDGDSIVATAAGEKTAAVYHVENDGNGSVQSWQFRCGKFGIKLLADHDYSHFDDGTWGDEVRSMSDPDYQQLTADFKSVTTKVSMGQVANFVCRWPRKTKDSPSVPNVPDDATARIRYLIAFVESMNKPAK